MNPEAIEKASFPQYDVLVVGAGPAGAVAAARAAQEGARVLLVERKAIVGVPVRCAEYIPIMLLREIDIPRSVIVQRTKGMRTWLPDGTVHDMAAPGCVVQRDRFDQALVDRACQAGVTLRLGCRVIGRPGAHTVILQSASAMREPISAGVIIGADGPHSTVARWMDATLPHRLAGIQVRVPLVRPLEHTEVFFEPRVFGGYAWLFPRGEEANVGLGVCPQKTGRASLRQLLQDVMARLAAEDKIKPQHHGYMAGWIPASAARQIVRDNLMLAGDAAGQTHPITGAGILPAVLAGNLAGKWAARAARAYNVTLLQHYQTEWQELWGDTQARALSRRHTLETRWDALHDIIRFCWVAFRDYHRQPI